MRTPIMSMGEAFRHPVRQHSRREALVCGDLRLTYGQIGEKITALACSLQRLGVGEGDRVAVVLLPGSEFVTLFFALAELGAVIVPINPLVRCEQLDYLLADSEPMAVVISQAQAEQAAKEGRSTESLRSKIPGLRHIILTYGNSEAGLLLASMTSAKPDPSFRPPNVAPDDLLTIPGSDLTFEEFRSIVARELGLDEQKVAPEASFFPTSAWTLFVWLTCCCVWKSWG